MNIYGINIITDKDTTGATNQAGRIHNVYPIIYRTQKTITKENIHEFNFLVNVIKEKYLGTVTDDMLQRTYLYIQCMNSAGETMPRMKIQINTQYEEH